MNLTYFWQPVDAANPLAYMGLRNNRYMRRAVPQQKDAPTLGFKSSHRFGPHGELVDSGGSCYMLSVVLGVTAGRGNSVAEVLHYLARAAAADGTHPKGTIYFVRNGDVRSRVRQRAFPAAVNALQELGVAPEILEGILPRNKPDVQGATIGAAGFDWKKSGRAYGRRRADRVCGGPALRLSHPTGLFGFPAHSRWRAHNG